MADIKDDLWSQLRVTRATVLAKVDGLSEYDLRRPLTPTGTNLLGLVKHLAGEEYGYLGETFDRPPAVRPSWFRDDPYTEIDMWATPDETSSYIINVYRQAAARRRDDSAPGIGQSRSGSTLGESADITGIDAGTDGRRNRPACWPC